MGALDFGAEVSDGFFQSPVGSTPLPSIMRITVRSGALVRCMTPFDTVNGIVMYGRPRCFKSVSPLQHRGRPYMTMPAGHMTKEIVPPPSGYIPSARSAPPGARRRFSEADIPPLIRIHSTRPVARSKVPRAVIYGYHQHRFDNHPGNVGLKWPPLGGGLMMSVSPASAI